MKTFKQYLNEFFEKNTDFDWGDSIGANNKKFKRNFYSARAEQNEVFFSHDDINYSILFNYNIQENAGEQTSYTTVSFWPLEDSNQNQGFNNAAQIFNKVINIILIYLNSWEPNYLDFSAASVTLSNFYKKIINSRNFQTILKEHEYKVLVQEDDFFSLERMY